MNAAKESYTGSWELIIGEVDLVKTSEKFGWALKNEEEFTWVMFSTKNKQHVYRACDKKECSLLKDLKAGLRACRKEVGGEAWASHAGDSEGFPKKLRIFVVKIQAKGSH